MILLPNGCKCSDPSVYPPHWKSAKKNDLDHKWYMQYYFHDPEFKDKYKYGKLVVVKAGINRLKTIGERKAAMKAMLDYEVSRLQGGWNPITNRTTSSFEFDYEIDPYTPVAEALKMASKKIKAAPSTESDIRSAQKYFIKSLKQLRVDHIPIREIRRRHMRATLDHLAEQRNLSNARYNKIRAYIMMIFAELVDRETIDINPIKEIKKRKTVKRLKTILTERERQKININLQKNTYGFWRFCQIFFHSGCRTTELLQVQKKDVDIHNLQFIITVKKGRSYEEQIRPINENIKFLWLDLLNQAKKEDYLFSIGLTPGSKKIREDQITRRWKRHVKDKLKINADFYALKHLHTDLIAEQAGLKMASAVNGHKSEAMALNHYAVNHEKRILETMKKLNISF